MNGGFFILDGAFVDLRVDAAQIPFLITDTTPRFASSGSPAATASKVGPS